LKIFELLPYPDWAGNLLQRSNVLLCRYSDETLNVNDNLIIVAQYNGRTNSLRGEIRIEHTSDNHHPFDLHFGVLFAL